MKSVASSPWPKSFFVYRGIESAHPLPRAQRFSVMKRSTVSFARLSRAVICVGAVLAAFAAFGNTAAHAGTVYSISNSLSGTSVQNGWTVAGTIELQDNTVFGTIFSSDIKSWQWTATKPDSSPYSGNSLTGNIYSLGGFNATATGLYFNDDQQAALELIGTGNSTLGWDNLYGSARFVLTDPESQPTAKFMVQPMDFPFDQTYGYQIAVTSSVPEIDPASFGSVAAFLTGALGLIEQRRRRRGRATALTA